MELTDEQLVFDEVVGRVHKVLETLGIEWDSLGVPSEEDVRFVLEHERRKIEKMLPGAAIDVGGLSTRRDESGVLEVYVKVGDYYESEDSTS